MRLRAPHHPILIDVLSLARSNNYHDWQTYSCILIFYRGACYTFALVASNHQRGITGYLGLVITTSWGENKEDVFDITPGADGILECKSLVSSLIASRSHDESGYCSMPTPEWKRSHSVGRREAITGWQAS